MNPGSGSEVERDNIGLSVYPSTASGPFWLASGGFSGGNACIDVRGH